MIFSDLDRELSLLATRDVASRGERVHDLARAVVLDDPPAVLALAVAFERLIALWNVGTMARVLGTQVSQHLFRGEIEEAIIMLSAER